MFNKIVNKLNNSLKKLKKYKIVMINQKYLKKFTKLFNNLMYKSLNKMLLKKKIQKLMCFSKVQKNQKIKLSLWKMIL